MTPDTVQLLARYNSHVNREMGRVLATLTDAQWNQALGGYYPSIRALCSHLFASDLTWLKRFAGLRPFRCGERPIFQRALTWGELLFPMFRDWERDRTELDEALAHFADEVTAEDLAARLRYKNLRGEGHERQLGGLIMHMFNHQTHHRGMVSLYLDMLGTQNDFSNLFVLV